MRATRSLFVAVYFASLLYGVHASAAPEPDAIETARRLFFEGVAAQDRAAFAEALESYARARAITVSPALLFNMATCEERLGHLVAAERSFAAAEALAGERADAAVARAARAQLDLLAAEIPSIVVHLAPSTRAAIVSIDGAERAVATTSTERVDPGTHEVRVRSSEHVHVFERSLIVQRGGASELFVDLGPSRADAAERAETVPSVPPPAARASFVPSIVLGSAALALGGGALGTALAGRTRRSDFEDLNAAPTAANRGERATLRSEGTALYTASTVLVIGAVACAGLAAYFFFRPPAKRSARSAERVLDSAWRGLSGIAF